MTKEELFKMIFENKNDRFEIYYDYIEHINVRFNMTEPINLNTFKQEYILWQRKIKLDRILND